MVSPATKFTTDDGLSKAVDAARVSASVLADPQDIENNAIFVWMGQHKLGKLNGREYAIGHSALPQRWRERCMRFPSVASATDFLRPLARKSAAVGAVMQVMQHVSRMCLIPTDSVTTLQRFAQMLTDGRAWLLEIKKLKQVIGKADPAVYAELNRRYACAVDFAYLSRWEGGQYLRGYVPFMSSGVVAGRSGMTIATGFDIGQKELGAFDTLLASSVVGEPALAAMRPYVGLRFTGLNRNAVEAIVSTTGPVPVLTKAAADIVDAAVHGEHLAAAIRNWTADRKAGVPAFGGLPVPWQTVIFSRHFHQGVGMPKTAVAKPFWAAATGGKWKDAVTALRAYAVTPDWYIQRVGAEATHLETVMPAAVVAPVKDAAAATPPAAP